ncbi:MAG TPA: threonine/serine exporter family protein [Ignavibacteria bacterium]|nr:threonine/serine exporter family protein [Ignavibacteria bacterium]HMR39269.1 threonine/serine exporter family protein [Ignavibacteria bacterium]
MNSIQAKDTNEIKSIVNSAANTALTVLHFNGVTAMAEKAFNNVMSLTNIKNFDILWRLDNITVTYKINGVSEYLIKPIYSIGTSLNGLDKTMEFSADVKSGKILVSGIDSELTRVIELPLIHKRIVYILLDGLAAAFYLKFHHGSFESIVIVFCAAMIGETVRYKLQSMSVPGNRIMFISGITSAGITGIILHFGFGTLDIITLIASIIYLVPGLRMINGFIDLTSLKYTFIGAQRLLNALYLLLILAVVILVAFSITLI